tara:strand:+ start:342 stop:674 length:333 start_codon:yes stop_codon:yes gene_type:complete
MIEGALYKNLGSQDNPYGYDFMKIMKIQSTRTIEWSPNSDRNDKQYEHFWCDMPNGDIQKIIDHEREIIFYCYNTKKRKNEIQKDLLTVSQWEFWECVQMFYELVSLDEK